MDKLEKFNILWKRYIDYYVVSNNEVKDLAFHNILGTILTTRNCGYIESAKRNSTRYHLFMFQNSGTGKTQLLKSCNNLLSSLKIPTKYTMKDNQSCCIGSCILLATQKKRLTNVVRGEITTVPRYGLLNEPKSNTDEQGVLIKQGECARIFGYFWDEGDVLLHTSSNMENLQEDFMGIMDEPGFVSKGMRLGTVSYKSNTSIFTGTWNIPEFNDNLLSKGFLQRMAISYKVFNEQEKKNIRIGIELLKKNVDESRIEKIINMVSSVITEFPTNKFIKFEDEAINKKCELMEGVYDEYIRGTFTGRLQDILETYYNRFHILVDKVATQRALVNGETDVTYDDVVYSLNVNRIHLESIIRLFENIRKDMNTSEPQNRIKKIVSFISLHGGTIERDELLSKLKEGHLSGAWDIGIKRSIILIDSMVDRKIIHSGRNKDDKIILFL